MFWYVIFAGSWSSLENFTYGGIIQNTLTLSAYLCDVSSCFTVPLKWTFELRKIFNAMSPINFLQCDKKDIDSGLWNTFNNNPKHSHKNTRLCSYSPTSLLKWHRLLKRTTLHFYQSHLFISFLFFSYLLNKSTKICHGLHSYRPKLLINQRARNSLSCCKIFHKYYIQVWINWTELNWDIQRRGTYALWG